jgi:hypothetical protein
MACQQALMSVDHSTRIKIPPKQNLLKCEGIWRLKTLYMIYCKPFFLFINTFVLLILCVSHVISFFFAKRQSTPELDQELF